MPPLVVVHFMPAVPVVAAVLYVGLLAARGGLCGARPGWVLAGLVGGNGGGGLTVLRVVVTGRCRSSSMIVTTGSMSSIHGRHDIPPGGMCREWIRWPVTARSDLTRGARTLPASPRSEEHTSELQSRGH